MIVLLLQHQHELRDILPGLRIPLSTGDPARSMTLPIDSGLSILFDKGLHFDDEGTCYIWHTNGNCYAIPLVIWSHPASSIREAILLHWPYGEQLSFWQELWSERSVAELSLMN